MSLLSRLRHPHLSQVWKDPQRATQTLLSFAETEEDGGRDLMAAAARVRDPHLRTRILHHAKDEVRHAEMFRSRAEALRAAHAVGSGDRGASDKAYDLGRGRRGGQVDAHGFLKAGLYDELGEVSYIAMVHVAEQNAARFFELQRNLTGHDPETREVFEKILKDEKIHVAYTGTCLDDWRAAGRGKEVDEGLKAAKGNRFFGAWKRLGLRLGANLSKIILLVFYWTILLPFGLIAKGKQLPGELRAPRSTEGLEAQY